MKNADFRMFVIYDHPKDFPDHFVVREWEIRAAEARPSDRQQLAGSLEEARKLIPGCVFQLDRHEADDPAIVEVWI